MPSSQHASSSTHPLGAGICVHLTSPVASPRAYRRSGTLSLHASPAVRPSAALTPAPVDDDPLLRSLQNGDISLDAVLAFPVHWHRLAASLSGPSSAPSSARTSTSESSPLSSAPEAPLRSTSLPVVPTERPTRPSRRAARFAALAHAAGSEASLDLQALRRSSALERALNSARQYVPPAPSAAPGIRRSSSAPDALLLAAAAGVSTTPRAAGCESADWDLISSPEDVSTPMPQCAPGSPRIPTLSLAPMSPSETHDEAAMAAAVPRSPQPLLPGALGLSFLTPAPSAPPLPVASESGAAGVSSMSDSSNHDDFLVAPDERKQLPTRPYAPAAALPVYDFAAAAAAATLAVEARTASRAPGWVAGWNGFGGAPRTSNSIA